MQLLFALNLEDTVVEGTQQRQRRMNPTSAEMGWVGLGAASLSGCQDDRSRPANLALGPCSWWIPTKVQQTQRLRPDVDREC